MKDASTDANTKDATSTAAAEMLVISMALALGLVFLAEMWPSPQAPLWWAGGAAAIFFVYAVVAAVRDLRKLLREMRQPEAGAESEPELQQSEPEFQQSEQGQEADEVLKAGQPAGLVIGAPSSDPTQLHSLEALRPETEKDFAVEDNASVPLYAESALFDLNKLAQGAREIQSGEVSSEADEEDPFEQPTELHSLEALRPETAEEITGMQEVEVSPLYAESALRDQQLLAKVAKQMREDDAERSQASDDQADLRAETEDDLTEKGDVEVTPLFAESALHDQQQLAKMARKIREQEEHADRQGDES